jgi:hypothetical protein
MPALVAAIGASERGRLAFSQDDQQVFVRLPATGAG